MALLVPDVIAPCVMAAERCRKILPTSDENVLHVNL